MNVVKFPLNPYPEARIIEETDSHVVIAMRVEKAFFARNLRFLAALADLVPVGEAAE